MKTASWYPPTFEGMVDTRSTYVSSVRTTLCDILSTTNTPFPVDDLPPVPPKLKPLIASLPSDRPVGVGPIKTTTLFQKFKVDDSKIRKVLELKREKELFYAKLNREKDTTTRKRHRAATKIQATFRGYRARPRSHSYVPNRKTKKNLTQFELQDELCQMAMDLHLKPLDGLNLEWRAKASKRRHKIENAAAFRLQKFFKMLYHRSIARVIVMRKRLDFVNRKAYVVTKAVRFMQTKNFVKRVDAMKRHRSAIVIQRQVRRFQAMQRVKFLRTKKFLDWKRNEAAIIIQRNMAGKHRDNLKLARVTLASLRSFRKLVIMLEIRIINDLLEKSLKDEIDNYVELYQGKVPPALQQAETRVIEDEVQELMELVAWEIALKQVQEEQERVAMERAMLEELLLMMAEDTWQEPTSSPPKMESKPSSPKVIQIEAITEEKPFDFVLSNDNNPGEEEQEITETPVSEEKENDPVASVAQGLLDAVITSVSEKVTKKRMSVFLVDATLKSAITSATSALLGHDSSKAESRPISPLGSDDGSRIKEVFEEDHEPAAVAALLETYAQEAEDRSIHSLQSNPEDERLSADLQSALSDEESILTVDAVARSAEEVKYCLESITQGRYDEAIENIDRNLTLLEQMLHRVSVKPSIDPAIKVPKISLVMNVLLLLKARAFHSIGKYADAKLLYERSLIDRKSLLHDRHYLVGEVYYYLAEWYRSMSFYAEAERWYLLADNIFVETLLQEESEEGEGDNSTIVTRVEADDDEEEEEDEEEVQSLTRDFNHQPPRQKSSPSRPDYVANDDFSVGSKGSKNRRKTDLIGEYQQEQQQVTNLADNSFSLPSPALLPTTSLVLLGGDDITSHQNQSITSRTKASSRPALYTAFKLYHRNVIAYVENLRSSGQYYKGAQLLKKIQRSLLHYKQLGLQSFEVKEEYISNYLQYLLLQGNYNVAMGVHQELLDKRRLHYGERHFKVATSFYYIAKLLLIKGDFEGAIQYLEECLQLRIDLYPVHYCTNIVEGPDGSITNASEEMVITHPAIAQCLLLKSEGFANLGGYENALLDAVKALDIYQGLFQNINEKHTTIINTFQWIYQLMYLMGEPKMSFTGLTNLITSAAMQGPESSGFINTTSILTNELHLKTIRVNHSIALNYLLCGNILPGRTLLLKLVDHYSLCNQQLKGRHDFLAGEDDMDLSKTLPSVSSKGDILATVLGKDTTTTLGETDDLLSHSTPSHRKHLLSPIEYEMMKFELLTTQLHSLKLLDLKPYYKRLIRRMNKIYQQAPNLPTVRYLLAFAEYCKIRGNYLDAKNVGNLAYDMMMPLHGEFHPLIVAILTESSDNLRIPGYYQEALTINAYALKLAYQIYPLDNEAVLNAVQLVPPNHLSYQEQKRKSLAEKHQRLQQAVHQQVTAEIQKLLESVVTPAVTPLQNSDSSATTTFTLKENVYILQVIYHRILIYRDLGEFSLAESFALYAIHYYLNHLLINTGIYALTLAVLADIYRLQGRYSLSKGIFRKALTLLEQFYSKESICYVETQALYAQLLMDAHHWSEAFTLWLQQILPVTETLVGRKHPLYLSCRVNFIMTKFYLDSETVLMSRGTAIINESITGGGNGEGSGVYSFSSEAIQQNNDYIAQFMKESEEIQWFHQFWEEHGFAKDHPWMSRLQYQLSDFLYYLDTSSTSTASGYESQTTSRSPRLQESSMQSEERSKRYSEYTDEDEDRSIHSSSYSRRKAESRRQQRRRSRGSRSIPEDSLVDSTDGSYEREEKEEDTRRKQSNGRRETEDDLYPRYRKDILSILSEDDRYDEGSWASDSIPREGSLQASYYSYESESRRSSQRGSRRPSVETQDRDKSERLSASYASRRQSRQRRREENSDLLSPRVDGDSHSVSSAGNSSLPSEITHSTLLDQQLKNLDKKPSFISKVESRRQSHSSKKDPRDDYSYEADNSFTANESLVDEHSHQELSINEFKLQSNALAEASELTN